MLGLGDTKQIRPRFSVQIIIMHPSSNLFIVGLLNAQISVLLGLIWWQRVISTMRKKKKKSKRSIHIYFCPFAVPSTLNASLLGPLLSLSHGNLWPSEVEMQGGSWVYMSLDMETYVINM